MSNKKTEDSLSHVSHLTSHLSISALGFHSMKKILLHFILAFILLHSLGFAQQRVKEIAAIDGMEGKQLIGYGLVVGLDGTGDSRRSLFTNQATANMLQRLGVTISAENIRLRNVASVMVTATIPAFASKGMATDVTVSSMGDARSLEGGVLLMTPLMGPDKTVYAYAQGPVSIGGFNVQTVSGERVRKNYTLVGRVPKGAQLINETITQIVKDNELGIQLKNPDFTTAFRLMQAINDFFNKKIATAKDAGEVIIKIPPEYQAQDRLVLFISEIELLEIQPDRVARIVINERTGTVVVGELVKIMPVAVAHGNLNLEIRSTPIVSQPPPFSSGETVVVPHTYTQVTTDNGQMMVIEGVANVRDVARALNALGVTPRDLIAIFQALKQAGAIDAELIIM